MIINSTYTSPNYSPRTRVIQFIILHFTEMNFHDALERLCEPTYSVSAHYLIKANGEIYQLVDDFNIAWHAGVSFWQGHTKLNDNSIGIEIDNLGNHPFPHEQMVSVINLCKYLCKKHRILPENILGHSDIAPERKIDPGKFFPWTDLLKHDLGIKFNPYKINNNDSKIMHKFGDQHSGVQSLQKKLRKIGYNIELSGTFDLNTKHVVRAFQLHFVSHLLERFSIEGLRDPNTYFYWDEYSNNIIEPVINFLKMN